jgi:hypothetical protein
MRSSSSDISFLMRTLILVSHASFAPFVPYRRIISLLSGHAIKISQQSHLSCAPPHCISHKRGIAETWDPAWGAGNNAFQVPIYRPTGTPPYLLIFIRPTSHTVNRIVFGFWGFDERCGLSIIVWILDT